jgi:hypothetical protein
MSHPRAQQNQPSRALQFGLLSLGILAAFLLTALPASGQKVVLELRNGDRISGRIVSETMDRLVLSNAWSREIVLAPRQVARRVWLPLTDPNSDLPILNPALTGQLAFLTDTNAAARSTKPVTPKRWVAEAQLGLDFAQNTKTREVVYGQAKFTYAKTPLRNVTEVSGSYGRTDGVEDANRVDGRNKTDYDLDRRWYIYNLAGVGYDVVRKIDFRSEVGPGVGNHIAKGSNFVLNVEIGGNYQTEDRSNGTEVDQFYARLGESGVWKISKKLSLEHRFDYQPSVEDSGQYRLRGEATIRYWLWTNISLNVTVADSYDTKPAPDVPPNDLQIRSTLGFKF